MASSRRFCNMAETIPEDLWIEILVRVPAIKVHQLRRISRFYKRLIDSPKFIRRHSSASINSECSKFVVVDDFGSLKFASTLTNLSSSFSKVRVEKFAPPLEEGLSKSYEIVGCCKGILCLRYQWSGDLMFWNPLTATFRHYVAVASSYDRDLIYFFGHDSVNDDLKVLRTKENHSEVYSSKTDCWKKISGLNVCIYHEYHCSDVVEGSNAIHIVVRDESTLLYDERRILAFDLSTDKFNELPLPTSLTYCMTHLSSLNGCLCFHVQMPLCMVVWKMKHYGVAESWSQLLRVTRFELVLRNIWVALDSVNDERELLLFPTEGRIKYICSYNIAEEKVIHKGTFEPPDLINKGEYMDNMDVFLYTPSLRPTALEFYNR